MLFRLPAAAMLAASLAAQSPAPPVSLPGMPLVGFPSASWSGGGPNGDRPAGDEPLPGFSCSAVYVVDPSTAPVSTSAWRGTLRVFTVNGGNCGAVSPGGCTFKGSLRIDNTSAREIEVCPAGVPLGSPSCVKIPAGGFHRFQHVNVLLNCDPLRKNHEEMAFSYFDAGAGKVSTGRVRFTCERCK